MVFVLIFIAGERLAAEHDPTAEERLAQAVDVIAGDVVEGYSARQRDLAMQLLAESDTSNPLVPALQTALTRIAAAPETQPGFATRAARRVGRAYDWLASQRWFLTLLLLIAAVGVLFNLRELSLAIFVDPEKGRFEPIAESTGGMLLAANLIAGASAGHRLLADPRLPARLVSVVPALGPRLAVARAAAGLLPGAVVGADRTHRQLAGDLGGRVRHRPGVGHGRSRPADRPRAFRLSFRRLQKP